jgi:hypothetical protein
MTMNITLMSLLLLLTLHMPVSYMLPVSRARSNGDQRWLAKWLVEGKTGTHTLAHYLILRSYIPAQSCEKFHILGCITAVP